MKLNDNYTSKLPENGIYENILNTNFQNSTYKSM